MNKNYNNMELEKMILAACIVNNDNLYKLIERNVSQEDFYFKNHKLIYQVMIINLQDNRITELNSLRMQLNGHADVEPIRKAINENAIADINNHIYIDNLLDLSKKRKYIQMLREIQNLDTDDIEQYITEQVKEINKNKKRNNNFITLDKVSTNNFYEVDKIQTGLIDLDKKINGFVEGSLVVLTGYSGNGKSTLINQMCIAESILQGKKVFAYSPELTNSMFKDWLYTTLANDDDFVEYEDKVIFNNKAKEHIDKWINNKLYMYDDNKITSSSTELLKGMEYLASQQGVKVFVIDNLMKINLEDAAKNEFIAQKLFVNQLKEFARKHGVIVHLVAHLKKPSETNKIITKFEVSGSVDITNIADYVISVSKVSKAQRKKESILKDCVIKVMKDRLTGNDEVFVNLSFDKVRKRFYGYDEELNKNYIA